ncbi:response regulator transcription factor [Actinoplanes sp. TFC3]|uniref:response regulator transcription factor n=1 Tax=Actinoplanes sp. TFC3 TaxID=1710355 RepID=UPI00082A0CBE|nr:response regulator transcription factor [Actinoplanes sp. TFC3]
MTTVLIVDDEADHRELMTLALRRFGYEVVAVENADQALRVTAGGGIDAALLDVRMPGISGIELCRQLRELPGTAQLPIMVVSADVNGARVMAATNAGADDYLTKPFHRAELGTRVEALLLRRERSGNKPATAAGAARLAARAAAALPSPAVRPAVAQPVRQPA